METDKASIKAFISAIAVIFALMVVTFVLTFIIPGGEYVRTADSVIDPDSFAFTEGGLAFWKFLLSPILVLTISGSGTLIAVIAFLLVLGGVFNSLTECGFLEYMLGKTVNRFSGSKYKLMTALVLFFMLLGSFIGSFEEVIPLVPIVVGLAIRLGWDDITGIGMSLVAVGCGFSAGIMNPFTIGVAQQLAGVPMFGGVWLRCVAFVLIFALLISFLRRHAKKIDRTKMFSTASEEPEFKPNRRMDKALLSFGVILGIGIVTVISSSFITALRDYTMVIVALMFLAAGIVSCIVAGMNRKELGKSFLAGTKFTAPCILMVLMASSLKYIMVESKIMDTVLYYAVNVASRMNKALIILFIYFIVLVMNFFISSGSAKAFMLIPLIVPIANVFGISTNLCIVAFAFGDGFSNVFYPSNAGLLISLNLAGTPYTRYAKWAWKYQLANLALTSGILLFGLAVGY